MGTTNGHRRVSRPSLSVPFRATLPPISSSVPPDSGVASDVPPRSRVSIEEQHVALPRLYGAPAYARPPRATTATADRPFDPDDLPIEAFQDEEDRAFAASLPARAWAPGGVAIGDVDGTTADGQRQRHLRGKPLNLRSIAGRLLRSD